MATDLIRYDVLVQQALRSVVRKVLSDAVKEGLPGAHHFYVSFRTDTGQAKLSQRLKDMYPEEMTIVLQHQYWDLAVSDAGFEVSLSFDKIPERLIVPYEAITGFFDPSVKFGLKFEAVDPDAEEEKQEPQEPAPVAKIGRKGKSSKMEDITDESEPVTAPKRTAKSEAAEKKKAAKSEQEAERPAPGAEEAGAQDAEGEKPAPGAEVVSLDAFRKKK